MLNSTPVQLTELLALSVTCLAKTGGRGSLGPGVPNRYWWLLLTFTCKTKPQQWQHTNKHPQGLSQTSLNRKPQSQCPSVKNKSQKENKTFLLTEDLQQKCLLPKKSFFHPRNDFLAPKKICFLTPEMYSIFQEYIFANSLSDESHFSPM